MDMDIERIVKEKIIDPPSIRDFTISCGTEEIPLAEGKFSKEEMEAILKNTYLFTEMIRRNIKPIAGIPEIKIYPKSDGLYIFIGGDRCRWRWK